MSEINPLGSSFYFSGIQNTVANAAKNEKKEKITTKKIKFSEVLKKSNELSEFELQGFPAEIADMSIEDAALYLKDKVDYLRVHNVTLHQRFFTTQHWIENCHES